MVDKGVDVDKGVLVRIGVCVIVGVGVEVPFLPSRPRVKTAAVPITRTILAMIPMIQAIQFTFFLTTSLKLGGTAISTTVMLSCPPRELASSIKVRAVTQIEEGSNGQGGMPKDFAKEKHGPRKLYTATLCGLVFASLSDDVPTIEEYLGEETTALRKLVSTGAITAIPQNSAGVGWVA